MNIKEVFKELNQKLYTLQQKVQQTNMDDPQIESEIEELKMKSEEIVEEWIKFEEKLGQFLQQGVKQQSHFALKSQMEQEDEHANQKEQLQELYEQWYQTWAKDKHEGEKQENQLYFSSENWKKGKALYDLLMFEHAVPYLEQVLKDNPELDAARLFLAHSYLAIDQNEKAVYHLNFLSETSRSQDIRHLALHGLACMAGALKQYDRSVKYFEKIEMEDVRAEWVPVFISNYALTLFHHQQYQDCLEQWKKYYVLSPHDWRGPFMLGKVCLALGEEEDALAYWFEALQIEEHVSLLKDMAKHFESKTFHGMASQCYERILQNRSAKDDVESWYGLAWNQGLAHKRARAEEVFIKALSLFPDHFELQIAYTWMLLYWNDQQKGLKSVLSLQRTQREHPLVLGLTYLYEGKFGEALDIIASHSV